MAESLQNKTWLKCVEDDASAAVNVVEGGVREEVARNAAASVSSSGNQSNIAVIQRVTASPRQVKTQIAKISYVPAGTTAAAAAANKRRQPTSPNRAKRSTPPPTELPQISVQRLQTETPLTTPPHSAQVEEFHKKKDERDKEIQEIQNMLNEITKSPQKQAAATSAAAAVKSAAEHETAPSSPAKAATEEPIKTASTTAATAASAMRRSKTETHFELRSKAATTRRELTRRAFGGGTSRVRSRSSQPSATKSNELLPAEEASAVKKKSYNPEEARRFMEEQKRKRRSNPAAAAGLLMVQPSFKREKSALEREQIKQRLEELRRNTRQIVNKNLKKKQAEHLAEQRSPRMDVLFRMSNTQRKAAPKNANEAEASPQKQRRHSDEPQPAAVATEDPRQLSLELLHGKASRKLPVEKRREEKSHKPLQVEKEVKAAVVASKPLTAVRDEAAHEESAQESTKREQPQKGSSSNRTQASLNSVKSAPPPQQPPPPLTENLHKRIGLLRKTELKDHSFSALKEFSFNKENVALEMMTPNFTMPQEARIKDKQTAAPLPQPPRETQHEESIQSKCEKEVRKDLHLEMPAAQLKSRTSTREKATEITPSLGWEAMTQKHSRTKTAAAAEEEPMQCSSSELPYWLKPSAVQIYPYNFIMAVRRKLEAIANPIPPTTNVCDTRNQTTSTGDLNTRRPSHETPLTSVPKQRIAEAQQNVKRRIGVEECHSGDSVATTTADDDEDADENNYTDDSFATHIVKSRKTASAENLKSRDKQASVAAPLNKKASSGEHVYRSQTTLSDFHSNFSSISIQMPASNTVSEVSSLKSESVPQLQQKLNSKSSAIKSVATVGEVEEDDNTTVSSSIFNSPEKKLQTKSKVVADSFEFIPPRAVSPLSVARIDKLKIRSKSKLKQAIVTKHITTERGDHSPKSITKSCVLEEPKSEDAAAEVGINFNQLLDDFNRSLSQVIQVNEQLKSTLDKSNQIFSPERKSRTASGDDDDQYTTDFEKSSSAHKDLELSVKQRAEDMQHSLRQRKRNLFELANAVKPLLTSPRSDDTDAGKVEDNPQLDLNFKSLTNSSANSSATIGSSKTVITSDGYEKSQSREKTAADAAPQQSFEKRLLEIEQLKKNLKQTIFDAKASRNDAERSEILHEGSKTPSRRKQKSAQSSPSNSQEVQEVSEALERSQSTANTPQKQHKYSKKSEVEIPKLAAAKQATQSESAADHRNSSSVSYQSPSSKSASKSTLNTAESKSFERHNETASHSSPSKAKTFQPQTQHSNSHSSTHSISTQKSSAVNYESFSIKEELQIAYESPSKENTNGNPKTTERSAEKKHHHRHRNHHQQRSSPQHSKGAHHSKHDAFVRTHINRSRGDFLPDLEETAASNESQFQAAITASVGRAGNADADNSSSTASLAPPSYHLSAPPTGNTKPIQKTSNQSPQSRTPTAIGSEIAAFFNQSDLELSLMSSKNDETLSESSLNYSNIGLYEKLIQTETTKSEHLTALLKMREKALLDRTKGQIAWLEVQKERYKAKGLLVQISAIKKKQRGILLKMEKEREEIKRLLQSTTSTTSTQSSARPQAHNGGSAASQTSPTKHRKASSATRTLQPPALLPLPPPLPPKSTRSNHHQHKQQQQQQHANASELINAATATTRSAPIIRADYKLESSRSLEELLHRRESDLRKRREHVERLMQWHQRLDQEEAEVLQLEHMLLNYNNNNNNAQQQASSTAAAPTSPSTTQAKPPNSLPKGQLPQPQRPRQQEAEKLSPSKKPHRQQQQQHHSHHHRTHKMERRLKEIDRSLRELSSISASNTTVNDESAVSLEPSAEFVRTTGSKLNKLWRRLTSQQIEKFEPNRRYKLCKIDLERLYEEAKIAVLRDFAHDEEHIAAELLERSDAASNSSCSRLSTSASETAAAAAARLPDSKLNVPRLNLNFSPATSDADEAVRNDDALPPASATAHYSPSAAEEDFQLLRSSAESAESSSSTTKSSSSSMSASATSAAKSQSPTTAPAAVSQVPSSPRERKIIIERNVAKFLARSQQLLGTAVAGGSELQRSLSDTQIVAPQPQTKATHAAPHVNIVISKRNIEAWRAMSAAAALQAGNKTNDKSRSPASGDTLQSVQSLGTNSSVSQRSAASSAGSSFSSPPPPPSDGGGGASNIPSPAAMSQQSDKVVFATGTRMNSHKSTNESSKAAPTISSNTSNSKSYSAAQSVRSTAADSREQSVIRSTGSAANSASIVTGGSSSLTEQFAKTYTDSRRAETASAAQSAQKASKDVTNSSVKSTNLVATPTAASNSLTLTDEVVSSSGNASNSAFVKSAAGSSSLAEQFTKTNTSSKPLETASIAQQSQQSTENATNSSLIKSANSPSVVVVSGSSLKLKVEFASDKTAKSLTTSVSTSEAEFALKTEENSTNATPSKTVSSSKTSRSPQLSASDAAAAASERQAREISAKLEQISDAVSQLSHANALPSYQSTNTATLSEIQTPSIDVEEDKSYDVTLQGDVEEEEEAADALHSTITGRDASICSTTYSCHFENISTDMQSPSGCAIKGNNSEEAGAVNSSPTPSANSATFISSAQLTLQSKTFTSDAATTPLSQSAAENRILDTYEADFELSADGAAGDAGGDAADVTQLDDLSMPQFETTIETTQEEDAEEAEDGVEVEHSVVSSSVPKAVEHIAAAEEAVSGAVLTVPLVSRELLPPPPPPPPAANAATAAANANNTLLMPDIINELEVRRCQQILLENEHLKQYEHVTAVPYMYVREIPNKPPPPYVPPAHGSPMTTIFPSEERIKDITYRRTHELYCEILKTDYINAKGEKLPTVAEEKITNIYERIILDICREYLDEHREVLTQGDPSNFHSQLAFFNPPDRLRCIQQSIYKEVRRCLAMDKTPPKRTQVYSVYGQRAKRDHIGKIIIQEMYDEDDQWCNFHREENEVLELIVEEMLKHETRQLCRETLVAEGGTLENEDDEEVEVSEEQQAEQTINKAEAAEEDEYEEEEASNETLDELAAASSICATSQVEYVAQHEEESLPCIDVNSSATH